MDLDIDKYFDDGIRLKMKHMLIVRDIVDDDIYVVYTKIVDRTTATLIKSESQVVLEVYDLSQNKEEQIKEQCNWRM